MKALSGSHETGMLVCTGSWTSDRQDDMSRKADRRDCEYRRQMRKREARNVWLS